MFPPGLMLALPVRVPGTAVFLTASPDVYLPRHNLHNSGTNATCSLTVETLAVPHAAAGEAG